MKLKIASAIVASFSLLTTPFSLHAEDDLYGLEAFESSPSSSKKGMIINVRTWDDTTLTNVGYGYKNDIVDINIGSELDAAIYGLVSGVFDLGVYSPDNGIDYDIFGTEVQIGAGFASYIPVIHIAGNKVRAFSDFSLLIEKLSYSATEPDDYWYWDEYTESGTSQILALGVMTKLNGYELSVKQEMYISGDRNSSSNGLTFSASLRRGFTFVLSTTRDSTNFGISWGFR